MIAHEGGDKIITVVVTTLPTQRERNAGLVASVLQQLGTKLFGQKLIGVAIVDQEFAKPGAVLDQGDGIMLAPTRLVVAEIAAERLDTPGRPRRGDNRRKRARRAVAAGMTERDRQCAMTAHGVSHDGLPPRIDGKVLRNKFRQLF